MRAVSRATHRREVQIPYFQVQIADFSPGAPRWCDEPIGVSRTRAGGRMRSDGAGPRPIGSVADDRWEADMRTIRIRVLTGLAAACLLLVALGGAPALGAPTPTTRLVSVNSNGIKANRDSGFPAVNASGSIIAFSSDATNLVSSDGNDRRDKFVRDD